MSKKSACRDGGFFSCQGKIEDQVDFSRMKIIINSQKSEENALRGNYSGRRSLLSTSPSLILPDFGLSVGPGSLYTLFSLPLFPKNRASRTEPWKQLPVERDPMTERPSTTPVPPGCIYQGPGTQPVRKNLSIR